MSLSDKEIIELNELCDRLVENNLSHDQNKRLEKWLSESEQARKFYISYLDMSVSLGYYADESLADEEEAEPQNITDKIVNFLQFWLPIAALFLFGGYLLYSLPLPFFEENQKSTDYVNIPQIEQKPEAKFKSLTQPAIAVLTKTVGLIWSNDKPNSVDIGSALQSGSFSFLRGMAQIEFMQGTTAIMEGPIDAELIHENRLSVKQGKIRAHVPQVAIGFTVELPMGKVIDLGTDFGVDVHHEGSAEVFVYRGKVKYQGVDFDGNEVSKELSSGEAIYLDPYGVLTPLDMPTGNFAGSADLASRSLETASRRHNGWLAKSKDLASSPNTLLYYGFDNHSPWARLLKDETKRKDGQGDGAVIGCSWSEGRWPGKGALQFSQDNDRVCLNMNQSLRSATLVAWVKLDSFGQFGAPLVFSRPSLSGALGWSISSVGKLVLEIKANDSFEKYESGVAFPDDRFGKWVHIATTFDGQNKWVNHFVNGRSFSREKIDKSEFISLRNGLLGHFQAFPNRNPNLSLRGCIDEFAIFDSAWDEKDIRELFEIGSPREHPF
jgi:hypothetical protein